VAASRGGASEGGGEPVARSGAECGRDGFFAAVRRLDPLRERGVPLDAELLDLARGLLRYEPSRRLSAAEALRHSALANAATAPPGEAPSHAARLLGVGASPVEAAELGRGGQGQADACGDAGG